MISYRETIRKPPALPREREHGCGRMTSSQTAHASQMCRCPKKESRNAIKQIGNKKDKKEKKKKRMEQSIRKRRKTKKRGQPES